MMDGRNCTGRKISLLNDGGDRAGTYPTKIQLPPLIAHSRAPSSCASTPSLTPLTPQLVRSQSSDSRSFQTPSPLTPSFGSFEQITHAHSTSQPQQHYYLLQHHAYNKMDDVNGSMYPPIPDQSGLMSSAYPMPAQMPQQILVQSQPAMQQQYRTSNSPQSDPSHVSAVSTTSAAKAQPKKNQYPCPMAKQIGCTDHFTTSGHAARHAKKHTGKKDAFCPECNKAFTRKDNMEQHRRTHQNGRSARSGDESKVKKPKAPASRKAVKVEPQLEAQIEAQLVEQQQPVQMQPQAQPVQQPLIDQTLMMAPSAGPYYLGTGLDTGPIGTMPMPIDLNGGRPPLTRSNYTNSLEFNMSAGAPSMLADPDLNFSYPSPNLSNGLNSLALAASEHQRRLSEEKSQARSPHSDSPSETPSSEVPSLP